MSRNLNKLELLLSILLTVLFPKTPLLTKVQSIRMENVAKTIFLIFPFQDMSVSNANQTNPLEAKRFERPDHAGILQACNRSQA